MFIDMINRKRCTRIKETRYIYFDKKEEKTVTFYVLVDDCSCGGVRVVASPAQVTHIQGRLFQDYIPGLSHIKLLKGGGVYEGIYTDFRGIQVNIIFFDKEDKILLFEDIPVNAIINFYTKDKTELIWSETVKINSYRDVCAPLGGEPLKIRLEEKDVEKIKNAKTMEVIIHTTQGDFKDERGI